MALLDAAFSIGHSDAALIIASIFCIAVSLAMFAAARNTYFRIFFGVLTFILTYPPLFILSKTLLGEDHYYITETVATIVPWSILFFIEWYRDSKRNRHLTSSQTSHDASPPYT